TFPAAPPVAFAPTVSPDANFVVYTRNARRGAACEPVGLADARSPNKTTPTRVLSPSQHTLDDPNQPTTKSPWRFGGEAIGQPGANKRSALGFGVQRGFPFGTVDWLRMAQLICKQSVTCLTKSVLVPCPREFALICTKWH
ncbi:hypothetical protein, partial [Pseudomonas extremaustralis]|uniref:hypothetical protein n=1 Tax=Pseudomonas extremaustralis TaxID=359110 RepID=UPI002307F05F